MEVQQCMSAYAVAQPAEAPALATEPLSIGRKERQAAATLASCKSGSSSGSGKRASKTGKRAADARQAQPLKVWQPTAVKAQARAGH